MLSSQLEGLCDGRKRVCNSFSFDLTSEAVVTCPDLSSESCDNDVALLCVAVLKEWILEEGSRVFDPVSPIFKSCPGICIHGGEINV